MINVKQLLQRVSIILVDEDLIRWDAPELVKWLNDGLMAIVLQKPSATAATVTLDLVPGTLQTLPAKYNSILRPVRNVRGDNSDRLPRKTLTVVDATQLNALKPEWHDSYSVPFGQQVKHFIFDEANPRSFYVYPGNDGNGHIELVLSGTPEKVKATGDELEIDSYDVEVSFPEIYANVLLNFILYRAYSKDAQVAGAMQRAAMYYQQFANELGIQVTVETNMSPNVKPGIGSGAVGVTQ